MNEIIIDEQNIKRFPEDFMLQLNDEEIDFMVSQNAIPSKQHLGGAKPYVFTEQGVSMLSAVLKTELAIEMSIKIVRAFVNMRKFLLSNASIFQRLDNIEHKLLKHDENFKKLFNAIIYHIGASLKDLGKKWFAFSKFDKDSFGLLERLL
jgi:hypothetical protein